MVNVTAALVRGSAIYLSWIWLIVNIFLHPAPDESSHLPRLLQEQYFAFTKEKLECFHVKLPTIPFTNVGRGGILPIYYYCK